MNITGTLIWYYTICPREVWLMSRQLHPYQDDTLIEIGRLISDSSYKRSRKEIAFENIKIDLLRKKGGTLIIGEVKKSSRFIKAARMQLAFYLYRLYKAGIFAKGELLIPEERKRTTVVLDDSLKKQVKEAIKNIQKLVQKSQPPAVKKILFCRRCAYREFCYI